VNAAGAIAEHLMAGPAVADLDPDGNRIQLFEAG
jgi:hypothetical protein